MDALDTKLDELEQKFSVNDCNCNEVTESLEQFDFLILFLTH